LTRAAVPFLTNRYHEDRTFHIAPFDYADFDQDIRSYLSEEVSMSTFVTVGRRLIPREHIAFVEPYDPSANPKIQTSRDFLARVMLVNRDSILIEEAPEAFAKANEFRMLAEDNVVVNPAVHFQVETFEPSEGFNPSKPYASRLRWRDLDGNDQSKLLLTNAETVLIVAVKGETGAPNGIDKAPRRASRRRRPAVAQARSSQP
jgi:hypothetical protein